MTSPAHRTITGPIAALEPALAEHVRAAKRDDPLRPVVILAGETLLRPYLRRRLVELAGPLVNVHVLTAGELGLVLGEHRLIAQGRAPLPVLASGVLAHEAALTTDGHFDAVRNTPGFANALHRTLSDLRRAAIGPDDLHQKASDLEERDKILALAALAERHTQLRGDHYDADDALAAADPDRFPAHELIVYGLWEAPEILRRAIEAIAATRAVTVYLPTAHPAADAVHAPLRGWAKDELGAQPSGLPAQPAASTLAHLQQQLAAPRPQPTTHTDSTVRIVSAPDPSREVRAALRTCLQWAREGIALHEMAIAYRHAEPYRALIAATAREAELAVYDHQGTPLAELPVGRRALALLDLLDNDLDRGSVIAFATDSRMPEATRERYPGTAAQWDAISRRAGVVRGPEQWRERLDAYHRLQSERYAEDPPAWLPERLAQVEGLARFVDHLAAAIARRPADAPWSAHVEHLAEVFDTYLRDYAPIVDSVGALSRLDRLTPTVSGERFVAAVRAVIGGLRDTETTSGRAGAFRARGINVLDVNSLRQLRLRAVCVLGLAERSFPPAPRQDALLLDAERAELGLAQRAHGPDPEPLQFALAVQAAQERLLLSHPRTEHGSGRPLIASSFLRGAVEALTGERIAAEELPDLEQPWLRRLGADRVGAPDTDGALDLAEYDRTLLETDPPVGLGTLARRRPNAARGREAWLARLTPGKLTPYEGGLTAAAEPNLRDHPKLSAPMSPSALETFAECPLRFFLGRVLGLGGLEEPEEIAQLSPLARGSLIHTVLERVMKDWLPDDPPSAQRAHAHLAQLDQVAREECAKAQALGITGYPALWETEREGILLDLRLWYEAEVRHGDSGDGPRFDAADFELSFGLDDQPDQDSRSTPQPLTLAVGEQVLQFHGRIDRLEWTEGAGAFRVIDYKTGVNRTQANRTFAGGHALQLPLYLRAAGDVILGRDWRAGSAEYFYSTRKGGFARVALSGDELFRRRDDFERILAGFASAIAGGTFPARPSQKECKFCAFRSLCPAVADHQAQVERKASDPRVAALRELEDVE
jgi:RecB family exonuclease